MKLINRKTLANEALQSWRIQYPRGEPENLRGTMERLEALGDNCDPDEVDKAIGNEAWTRVPECGECGKSVPALVMVGEEPDYESSTAFVCESCLRKALDIISVK